MKKTKKLKKRIRLLEDVTAHLIGRMERLDDHVTYLACQVAMRSCHGRKISASSGTGEWMWVERETEE